jgi:3-phenylpropionate/trans-cinnamate dioxygenase ferredoxin reductase subunit
VPDRAVDYLLIGGGVASASCARTLRNEGADGSILLVGRETGAPYERPPLSKGYLRGGSERVEAELPGDLELASRTSVTKIDSGARVATLSTKEEVAFGKALVATGANVRRLRVDGSDLDGIHYLRTSQNADAIRADAADAERVVLIGGSYIACEVAATLTALGRRCTLVMLEATTLEAHLGKELGRFVERGLRERGVELACSDELERFRGEDDRVRGVVTKGGRELPADLVVIGAGVVPDTMLARSAGLELGETGGIACSSRLETSAPGIYAAGDVAEYESALHDGPARVEHHEVAIGHGRTAALNMLGRDVAHEEVPYFWSDLGDWATIEYVGIGGGDDVVRGSLEHGDFTVFYLHGERLVSAATVGRPRELAEARRLIAERATPGRAALADPGTDLAAL